MRHDGDETASPRAAPAYEVGYRRPPQHSQFQPGQSGNPRGRAKGQLNSRTYLDRALNQKVVVNEQGRSRTISKREAIATQLVNRAAGKGDLGAIKLLHSMELAHRREHRAAMNSVPALSSTAHQQRECDIDFDAMTTEELSKVQESFEIMEAYDRNAPGQPSGIPMPPTGPTKSRREK